MLATLRTKALDSTLLLGKAGKGERAWVARSRGRAEEDNPLPHASTHQALGLCSQVW